MDYSKTLNLPNTAFPMKADLPTREPGIQARWNEIDLYKRSLEKNNPAGPFVLHDGPPYSNGNIHLGHALNKVLKDIVVKHRSMKGHFAPYVPGWDNHGLPIEVQVVREFREKKEAWTPDTLRARCRTYAAEWVNVQREQFKRLGVRGDWENPYLTMAPEFEASIVETLLEMARRGYVYRGLKPVLWDPGNETALANTEAEYKDNYVSPAIYVGFPLAEGGDPDGLLGGADVRALIWTTTPWTIPANLALTVHPDFDYVVVTTERAGRLLLLRELLEATVAACDLGAATVERTLTGAQLEGLRFVHPMAPLGAPFERDSVVCLAHYVTTDTGTGIVHTAPGHGADDYLTGVKYGLPILSPLDGRGRYTDEAGPELAGLSTDEANRVVPEKLAALGALLGRHDYAHKYPHSPRAPYKPLLFRATVQWFVSVGHDGLREKALGGIQTVEWFPAQAENRITAAVAGRPDWTISRQRHWGVPIALFYADGEPVFDETAFDAAVALIRAHGIEAWYGTAPEEILPAGYTYNGTPAAAFVKEKDVLDVWFDSGSTSFAVLDSGRWPELSWPADVYLEGSDQHRGWFNSSLLIASALRGRPPYKQVVTNGFTVDELGYKMSKSKGNTVDPLGVVERYGADVLRLWVGSIEYTEDTKLGDGILKQLADAYRKLRNTFRFLLGNLSDYTPADAVAIEALDPLDRWALSRLQTLVADCGAAYDVYEFYRATQAVLNFCNVELSSFYLDVLKDRLYTELPESARRRSSQTALWEIASVLCRLMAPILSHTCEEVWQHLPGATDQALSPQLAPFPTVRPELQSPETEALFATILTARDAFNAAMEPLRVSGELTKTAEAWAHVVAPLDASHAELLRDCLIAGKLTLTRGDTISATVERAPGQKCARSWFVREDVGADPGHPTLSAAQAAIVRELIARGAVPAEA